MKRLFLLILAMSFAVGCQILVGESNLKQTLQSRLSEIGANASQGAQSSFVFCSSANRFFSVPKDVALILENNSSEKLIPVIMSLKPIDNGIGISIINNWLVVDRQHLHGKPFSKLLCNPPTEFYGYHGLEDHHDFKP